MKKSAKEKYMSSNLFKFRLAEVVFHLSTQKQSWVVSCIFGLYYWLRTTLHSEYNSPLIFDLEEYLLASNIVEQSEKHSIHTGLFLAQSRWIHYIIPWYSLGNRSENHLTSSPSSKWCNLNSMSVDCKMQTFHQTQQCPHSIESVPNLGAMINFVSEWNTWMNSLSTVYICTLWMSLGI